MTIEDFFSENSRTSGALSRINYFHKNFEDDYNKIMDFTIDYSDISFKERLYRYFNNDLSEKKCKCGAPLLIKSIRTGFPLFCSSKCANKASVDKVSNTKNMRYGNPNYNNAEKFKESMKKTLSERGIEISKARKKTKMDKYGDPNYTNREKAILTRRDTDFYNVSEKILRFNVELMSINIDSSYIIKCRECDNIMTVLNSSSNARIRKNITPCTYCYNINSGTSKEETNLANFIESLGLKVERNSRKILSGKEIDILIEDRKIAFEYNGLYWHSEERCERNYHLDKQEKCMEMGVELIHIWEDDWIYKNEIIKSRIKHKLGISEHKIFSRKCKIKEVNFKETSLFLTENHIQGSCPSKYNIGLYYNDILVSICTFGKRKISGSSDFELIRFCNKISHNVVGAFSRLLSYFISNNPDIKRIITFADKCWTPNKIENLYTKNGFSLIGESKPGYWYNIDGKRHHRYNFRKDILISQGFDKTKSEREIMLDRGLYRIYDCGQFKYELIL